MESIWSLDPDITFLNHGSFGACPRAVLDVQASFRARMESEPVRFFMRELEELLDGARAELARFVGADPASIVFVTNATTAVNGVLRSMKLSPGDELLTTDHAYAACKNVLDFVADREGVRVVVTKVPFPIASPDEVVSAILAGVTPKTRLAMIDHVTSPTGLVFPIERIVKELDARGVDTLVDGAHGPGMVPLDLRSLGAAYYTGNLHKWVCAPKGAAFLSTREDKREAVRPVVISHGATAHRSDRTRYHLEHDYTGTFDPSAILSVPAAIRLLDGLLPGGFPELMRKNRDKVLSARRLLCETLGVEAPAPESMIGSLASILFPARFASETLSPIQDRLFFEHRIEVPMMFFPLGDRRVLRVAAQYYNGDDDYRRLASALTTILSL